MDLLTLKPTLAFALWKNLSVPALFQLLFKFDLLSVVYLGVCTVHRLKVATWKLLGNIVRQANTGHTRPQDIARHEPGRPNSRCQLIPLGQCLLNIIVPVDFRAIPVNTVKLSKPKPLTVFISSVLPWWFLHHHYPSYNPSLEFVPLWIMQFKMIFQSFSILWYFAELLDTKVMTCHDARLVSVTTLLQT